MYRITAIACLAAAATVANADTVDVKFLGTGKGSSASVKINGNNKHVFVGQLKHRFSNGSGAGEAIDGDFITFCSDLTQYVSTSTKTFTVEDLEDMPKSPNIPAMGADSAQAIFDIYKAAGGDQLKANADKTLAAAFQLAIWEIVYDYTGEAGDLDTSSGSFRINSIKNQDAAAVNAHLTSLFGAVGNGGTGEGLYGVASWHAQDQLVIVPLPAPVMLGGIGLGAAFLVRRRMNRA